MTDLEIEKLGIKNDIIDNFCIVSCSDDMTIKFWVNYAGEGPYNVISILFIILNWINNEN